MDLSKDLWYVRWFFWSVDIIAECANWQGEHRRSRNRNYYERHGTTLCQFMRVVLVWAPLVLILNAIVYGTALASFTVVPTYLFGWGYGLTLAGFGTFLLFCWGIGLFWRKALPPIAKVGQTGVTKIDTAIDNRAQRRIIEGPGFLELLWLQIVSAKRKICPMIRFN